MKHMKKTLAIILALALVLPALLMPASAASTRLSFPDVKTSDWFYPYVTQLAQAGGVHGLPDGTFQPKAIITRAEVATIAVNLFQPQPIIEAECPANFYDAYKARVEQSLGNHWAKDAVFYAALCIDDFSYVDGYDWTKTATRVDIAVILINVYATVMFSKGLLTEEEWAIPTEDRAALLIGDYDKIKDLDAAEDIIWLYAKGIIKGVNNNRDFNPDGTASRAEVCKIAVNLMDPSQRDKVDWDEIMYGPRYEKDFTGKERARYPQDVAFDYCRALEEQIGIQIFYIPYEWTDKADGLFSSDEAYQVIISNGLDNFYKDVLTELQKMKAAYDKYPAGFLKEMAQKKGNRTAEIILCPYGVQGCHGQYVYDYSSDAKKVDQIYYAGKGDTHYYSHEMGHMVYSAAAILYGWYATESAWEKLRTADGGSYISAYAITTKQEDQAETWAFMWEEPQTVIQACSNAGLRAKVQLFTQILDKNYSTFHSSQVPWASVLK